MTYKTQISYYLQICLDTGLTQAELATRLGFKSSNLISMHLDPNHAISPFPIKRLPALARECGLNAYECLVLLHKRSACHPDSATRLDKETLHFLVRCSAGAASARKSCKLSSGSHAGAGS